MQTTLKLFAALIVGLIGILWAWGHARLDQMGFSHWLVMMLMLRLVLLCIAAWMIRIARRRTAGLSAAINTKLLRDRTLAVAGLLAVCFGFALALDRLGDRPHPSFARGAMVAAWDAVGIVSVVFCAVCLVGGGKR